MKYIKWLTVSLIIGLGFLLSSTQVNAQQSNKSRVYINPSVTKVKPGEEVTVSVKADIINPKGNITYLWVEYDKTKLSFVGVSDKTSTFSQTYAYDGDRSTYDNTNIRVVSFLASVANSNEHPKGTGLLLFNIKFRAKSESFTKLNFNRSKSYLSNHNINLEFEGGSILIGNPKCPTGQTGTPPNCKIGPNNHNQNQNNNGNNNQNGGSKNNNSNSGSNNNSSSGNNTNIPTITPARPRPQPSVVNPSTIANRISRPSSQSSQRIYRDYTPRANVDINSTYSPSTPTETPSSPADTSSIPAESNTDTTSETNNTTDGADGDYSSIRGIQIEPSYKSTTIKWIADNSTISDFYYGEGENNVTKKATSTKSNGANYQATIDKLTPGKTYYYIITASNEKDSSGDSYRRGKFTTLGYPVKLILKDNSKPIAGASISSKDIKTPITTKEDGSAETTLPAGDHTVDIDINGTKAKSNFIVQDVKPDEGEKPETQEIIIGIKLGDNGAGVVIGIIIAIISFVIICAIVAFIKIKNRGAIVNNDYNYSPSVMIDDDFTPPSPTDQTQIAQQYYQQNPQYTQYTNTIDSNQYYTPMMQVDPNSYQNRQEDIPENELLANLPYSSPKDRDENIQQ